MQDRFNQVRTRALELIKRANQLYNTTLPPIDIKFNLRGRVAGYAGYKGDYYYLRFNRDMIMGDAFDHILKDTVPHEIAHLVNFHLPHTGNAHNPGWQRVCFALGGNSQRLHNLPVKFARGRTFEYINTHGRAIRISETIHNKIQRGQTRKCSSDGGLLHKQCKFTVV